MNHFKPLKILKNLNLRASCKNQSKSCPNSRQGIHSWHGRHVSGTTSSCGVTLHSLSQVLLPEFQFLLCSRRPFGIVQKGPTNPSPFHGTYHELTREFGIHIILWQPTFSEKRELCWGLLVHTVLKTQFGSTKRHFLKKRPVDEPALQDFSSCFSTCHPRTNHFSNEMLEKTRLLKFSEQRNLQRAFKHLGPKPPPLDGVKWKGRLNCLAAEKVSWPQHQLWTECPQWLFTSSTKYLSWLQCVIHIIWHILHSITPFFSGQYQYGSVSKPIVPL